MAEPPRTCRCAYRRAALRVRNAHRRHRYFTRDDYGPRYTAVRGFPGWFGATIGYPAVRFAAAGATARRLLLAGALVVGLSAALVVTIPAPTTAPAEAQTPADRNLERARATLASIERHFQTDDGRFLEVYPSSAGAYATLWPRSQLEVGELLVSALSSEGVAPASLAAFEPYWDALGSPPGYSASVSGDRKFFDDNAWTGLALVQAYRLTGDRAALERARQIFDFTVSGWDPDPTHADPGGVWWSQQMPNPRFIHRNTISTASGAVLALQLYEATGRTQLEYLDWASRMYTWVDTYLRGNNGLYGDHVDLAGVVDPGQLTYNQGMMIETRAALQRLARPHLTCSCAGYRRHFTRAMGS